MEPLKDNKNSSENIRSQPESIHRDGLILISTIDIWHPRYSVRLSLLFRLGCRGKLITVAYRVVDGLFACDTGRRGIGGGQLGGRDELW